MTSRFSSLRFTWSFFVSRSRTTHGEWPDLTTMDYVANNTTAVGEGSSKAGLALGLLVLLCPIMLLAVAGNLLVLISYVRDVRLRSVHNWYIVNLACADFLIGCFSMPLYVMYTLQHQTWTLGRTFCKVFITVDNTLCLETVLLIILISWDRLLLLRCGLDYRVKVTMPGACIRVALSWVMAFSLHGPANLAWTAVTGYSVVPNKECDTEFFDNFAFTLATSLIEFVLSFLLLTIINTSLYLRIRKRKQLARTENGLPRTVNPCICKPSSHGFSKDQSDILKRIFNVHESKTNQAATTSKTQNFSASEGNRCKSQAIACTVSASEWPKQNGTCTDENVLVTTQTNGESCSSPDLENMCDEQKLTSTVESTVIVLEQKDPEASNRNSSSSAVFAKSGWYYEDHDDDETTEDPWEKSASYDDDKGPNDTNYDLPPNGHTLTSDQDSKCVSGVNDDLDSGNSAMSRIAPDKSCTGLVEPENNLEPSKSSLDQPTIDDHSKTVTAYASTGEASSARYTKSNSEEGGISLVRPSMSSGECPCSKRARSKSRRDLKAAKALLALVLTFLVTWGPYTVVTIANSACSACIHSEVVDVFTWLLWSKSALNPLLYAFHSPRFRQNFRLLLSCAISRCRNTAKRSS